MYQYVVKRVLLMIPTLLGAAVLVFFLMRLIPGDICELRLAGSGATFSQDALDNCRREVGIDQPVIVQFGSFLWGLVTFDLGTSMWTGRPIVQEIGLRFELSLMIAVLATITATLFAIPLGTIAALKQDTWVDYVVRIISIVGIATPSFWFGILIIFGILFTTQWWTGVPWMPPIEYKSDWSSWANVQNNLNLLIWPALATGYRYSAVAMRMTRSTMLEVLREDYVRTARAKGLIERLVVVRHSLKNAMLPVVTVIALEFAFLMGGLVVTEQVFNLNGLGKLFVESVLNYDYTMTQALVMVVVLVFIFTNFAVDIFYAWLDPRIRYR
jgi:peptide/nickel transport system permease protein